MLTFTTHQQTYSARIEHLNIVIAGAGIVGNSIAYYLTRDYAPAAVSITLVDPAGICPAASAPPSECLATAATDARGCRPRPRSWMAGGGRGGGVGGGRGNRSRGRELVAARRVRRSPEGRGRRGRGGAVVDPVRDGAPARRRGGGGGRPCLFAAGPLTPVSSRAANDQNAPHSA